MILSYRQSSLKAWVTLSSACPVQLQWLYLQPAHVVVVASGFQTCFGFGGFVLVVAGNLHKGFKAMCVTTGPDCFENQM